MLDAKLKHALNDLKQSHRIRTRTAHNGAHGQKISLNGKNHINFCSNDYLGLSQHPAVQAAFIEGCKQYGVGATASPLIVGYTAAHEALENELAHFFNRPRALLFNSGYTANLSVLSALPQKDDTLFLDKLSHASLVEGAKHSGNSFRRYPHANMPILSNWLEATPKGAGVIITDGIFSMDGDVAPYAALAALRAQHHAALVVDDAHGMGVMGNGQGSVYEAGINDSVDVLVGTCGKALGTMGAYVLGSEAVIETLINLSKPYIYSTMQAPALAVATRASLKVLQEESWRRTHLHELIQYYRTVASQTQVAVLPSHTPIQGILVHDNAKALALSEALKNEGILALAIRPPTVPENTARLRITLTALHQKQDIDALFDCLLKHQ